MDRKPVIAVLVPCLNEAGAIAKVVADFKTALPEATIYVYDNGSTDDTMKVAQAAGAVVREQPLKGKGNVVRRMFADVEADVYLLVDGDDTYDAKAAPALVDKLLHNCADMVNASRVSEAVAAYRAGHRFGNVMLTSLVAWFFGNHIRDLLSGYRVFSRRFVKSFPAQSAGFEIETELSVHALQLRMPLAEVPTVYKERAEGTESKLSTYRDGWRILRTIAYLVREEKPFAFFSWVATVLLALALLLGIPVVLEYLSTGLVPRLPSALLATALVLLGFLSFTCGLILDSVSKSRTELRRLSYLSVPVRFSR
ncbi:MAG: glycosyltransferase family 2 protein [Steroidobacteraceae bacterium]